MAAIEVVRAGCDKVKVQVFMYDMKMRLGPACYLLHDLHALKAIASSIKLDLGHTICPRIDLEPIEEEGDPSGEPSAGDPLVRLSEKVQVSLSTLEKTCGYFLGFKINERIPIERLVSTLMILILFCFLSHQF